MARSRVILAFIFRKKDGLGNSGSLGRRPGEGTSEGPLGHFKIRRDSDEIENDKLLVSSGEGRGFESGR